MSYARATLAALSASLMGFAGPAYATDDPLDQIIVTGSRAPLAISALASALLMVLLGCVSLDDDIDQKIDFIKIDAEGFEPNVWAGMQRHVREDRPTLLVEYAPASYADPRGFLDEMLSAGYELRVVNTEGGLRRAEPAQVAETDHFEMLWLSPKG